MRKPYFFLIVLCICMLLCACRADDPDNLFGTEQPSETTQMKVTEETTSPVATDEGYYQYGNMQKGNPAGNFMVYSNEILFAASPGSNILLYSYDISTGEVSLLCKDATCSHTLGAKNCLSNGADGNLEQYYGKFYAINGKQQIVELIDGQFEKVVDGSAFGFWHANGNLYAITTDQSLIVYESGSHTPRILLDEYTERWNVVFGQYLYSGFGQGVCRVDLSTENPQLEVLVKDARGRTDGQYIYYIDLKSNNLFRCDMAGGNPELLIDQSVLSGSMNFDDEYLYFRLFQDDDLYGDGTNILYRLSKVDPSQMEQIAELPEPIEEVYTIPGYDLLFVRTVDLGEPEGEYYPNAIRYLYVMNTDGSNVAPLELPDY